MTQGFDVPLRGAAAMLARNRDVYLKTWKTNFVAPLVEPLLYLLSFGYGLGMLVKGGVGGVSYKQFVAPAILSITMMQSAFFETTYGSFVRMHFQKTWEAVTATPLLLDDVLVGEVAWAASKSAINCAVMSLVVAAFGLMPWSAIPLVALVAFLVGLLFAGLGLAICATVPNIDSFQFSIYLLVTPMMLFAGTFFPLQQLPSWAQAVAQALPLTHAVLVTRPLVYGTGTIPWISLLYLAGVGIALCALAIRLMKRKLLA